jgi:hypothetical protein
MRLGINAWIDIGIMLIIWIYIFIMANFKIVVIFLFFTLLCISYHSVMKLPGSEPDFFLLKLRDLSDSNYR